MYKRQPLLSPEAAVVTLRMLEDDAHFVRSKEGPVPLRFKTGTSNGFRDAWTAGVVGPYVLEMCIRDSCIAVLRRRTRAGCFGSGSGLCPDRCDRAS